MHTAPTPAVEGNVRQFFNADGSPFFVAVVKGRRPDVSDSLRCLGTGHSRAVALQDAENNFRSAWRSLHPAVKSTSE